MKVRILATGKVQDFAPAYAVRLIEQGQAVKAEEAEGEPGKKGKK